ncbi:PIN domain-containing protein [Streptomyces sp. AK010]|uniref:PIN domain-containing protein n=1 Tax=Streptomyces sp. AK010 TaxID=2723074 RepID=UPI0016181564|nr:PIN domain-containing protein [Streptomyces sp. AK010]
MRALIFLDTNVLPRQGSIRNVLMSAVLKVASHNDLRVCISEVVLEESVNIRKSLVAEAIQKLQEAFNQASKLMELEPIYIPDLSEIASSWRDELEAAFEVIPLGGVQAVAALKREAARRRPARDGKGARDSAIWLSALEVAVANGAPVHFVSDNRADFADTANANLLHPDLLEDCKARGVEVIYHRNLDSLLDKLSSKSQNTPSIGSVSAVKNMFLEALFETGLPHRISEEFYGSAGFSLDAEVKDVKKIKSYQVDDAILSLVDIDVEVDTESTGDGDVKEIPLLVGCRAWVQSSHSAGAISSIDVEEVSSVTVR